MGFTLIPVGSARFEPAPSLPWFDPSVVEQVQRSLVPSVEPAVVFTSLANAVVPALARRCSIAVRDEHGGAFAIRRPIVGDRTGSAPAASTRGVMVRAGALQAEFVGHPAYTISVWFLVDFGESPDTVAAVEMLASSMIVQSVDLVRCIRLEVALEQARTKVLNLETALESNRVIAQAVGILMASRRLTDVQSFDLLRDVSRRRRRKLHELAEDVARTGELDEGADQRPSVSRGSSPKASR